MKKKTMLFVCLLSVGTAFATVNLSQDRNHSTLQLRSSLGVVNLTQGSGVNLLDKLAKVEAEGDLAEALKGATGVDLGEIGASVEGFCNLREKIVQKAQVKSEKEINQSDTDQNKSVETIKSKEKVEAEKAKADFIENLRKYKDIVGGEVLHRLERVLEDKASYNDAVLLYVAFQKKLFSLDGTVESNKGSTRADKAARTSALQILTKVAGFMNALISEDPAEGIKDVFDNKGKRLEQKQNIQSLLQRQDVESKSMAVKKDEAEAEQ